ncbi:MAG: F0F1 ATP synthase subunit A [Bacteroidales bacterium]|nr:F0F1 ATP synthase subunit A [Bacteroidales bacterium]
MKFTITIVATLLLFFKPLFLLASEKKEFDPSELIMHHISDAYEWHIITVGEKHITLYLPIILFDEGRLICFSSANFNHGQSSYLSYKIAHEGKYQGKIVKTNEKGEIVGVPLSFSITKNVVVLFIAFLLLVTIFISIARFYQKYGSHQPPRGLAAWLEPIILFIVDDVAKQNIGEFHYKRFAPYLLTLFFFILINNLMGLIPFFPFGANLTGNISVTLTLAFLTLLIVNFNGNKSYWKHIFMPSGVPWLLWPILVPVEIIGIFTKPFALMIRLFANITAGHIIILSLISLIFIFKSIWIAPVSVGFVLFMSLLELLVAFLQAYIFTMLTALFIGLAMPEEHH